MRDGFESMSNLPEDMDRKLDALFLAYRDACPVPEAKADFMPRLWARIEGRQQAQAMFAWRRWAQAFLSVAAAVCLLIVGFEVLPRSTSAYLHSSYIEQLSEEDGPEHMVLQEVATADPQPAMPAHAPEGTNGK